MKIIPLLLAVLCAASLFGQDTLYIFKSGSIIYQKPVRKIDSVLFNASDYHQSNTQTAIAKFASSTTSATAGESISFTDKSTNTPTSWSWDFGDGSTSAKQNITHTYSESGEYDVTLTVTSKNGETSVFTTTISIGGELNDPADINGKWLASSGKGVTVDGTTAVYYSFSSALQDAADDGVISIGDVVFKNITPQNDGTYSCDTRWIDGKSSGGSVVYTSSKWSVTASITLTTYNGEKAILVEDESPSGKTSSTYYIWQSGTIDKIPVASFVASDIEIVEGESISFTDQSTNNPTSWSWNFGDGTTSSLQNPTHSYSAEGTYSVTLTVSNSASYDTETKTVTVSSAVNNNLKVNWGHPGAAYGMYYFTGETVSFTDYSEEVSIDQITAWFWEFGDGTTSRQQNPTHSYAKEGIYNVTLTISNKDGSNSASMTIEVKNEKPIAHFSADGTTIKAGETVSFTDNSFNKPTSWSWDFGDGATSSLQNPTHTYSTAGTYSVELTATNDYGSDSETKDITVSVPTPKASFTTSSTSVSVGESISFTDQSTNNPTSWSWDFGDGTTSSLQNPTHSYSAEGAYSVTLAVSNSIGSDSETKTAYVNASAGNSNITVTDYDGNVYNTVTIGDQVWMAQNLRVTHYADGTAITLAQSSDAWSALDETDKAYCFYDVASDDDYSVYDEEKFGALYTWAAATAGVNSEANPRGVQGACPDGWHIPSDDEWTELTDYLGGEDVSGGKLKETGTFYWINPNEGATNETGFTALPGGARGTYGAFNSIGVGGSWWSATENHAAYAWRHYMNSSNSGVGSGSIYKRVGVSVRCVKD